MNLEIFQAKSLLSNMRRVSRLGTFTNSVQFLPAQISISEKRGGRDCHMINLFSGNQEA